MGYYTTYCLFTVPKKIAKSIPRLDPVTGALDSFFQNVYINFEKKNLAPQSLGLYQDIYYIACFVNMVV